MKKNNYWNNVCPQKISRDDLIDGGSNHIAATIKAIKRHNPKILVECLAPDFAGNLENAER